MTPEQFAALRKPFDAKTVGKLPKGGVTLDFVGHAAVTDRLLAVDEGWSWEPVALDETGLPAYDRAGGLWIRLTVAGVTRLGYGDGPDPKQRIGDAIRNAAMRFGVALDLWSRQELEGTDPNGGDALGKRPAPERKAERGPVPAESDPWLSDVDTPAQAPKHRETDPKWLSDWRDRAVACSSMGALRGLWSEAVVQHKGGRVTDGDFADLQALKDEVKTDLEAAETVAAVAS